MKKAMFNKFTNFIQQTVDAFTPQLPPQEEFVYHWKSVTSYFVDNKDGSVRIEETALPEHLSSMLEIIQQEELDLGEAGTTGACLEYLLQHRLLETLYTLGRTDHPPGMKQIVLIFFTKMLSRISHPLLPHINVHKAVQRLVKACGETKAAPTEKEEIEFLCTVCAKIKADPYLANFFIEKVQPTVNEMKNSQKPTIVRPSLQPFSLVTALLTLSRSEDARVAVKACEGLMLCASLPEPTAATTIINETDFCESLTQKLCEVFEKLPLVVCPEELDQVEAKWGFNIVVERSERHSFTGRGHVISFLSWLDYCDQLISVANPDVGAALATTLHDQFLTGRLLPQLTQQSEAGAIVATTYLTRCLRTVSSHALLREFSHFLLGKEREIEEKKDTVHPLYKRLLERCNHLSEEVCISTLKLFDTLLQKEDEHIYHCLLLRNLLCRGYFSGEADTSDTSCDKHNSPQDEQHADKSPEEQCCGDMNKNERENVAVESNISEKQSEKTSKTGDPSQQKGETGKKTKEKEEKPTSPSTPDIPSSFSSFALGRTDIHKVVNCFLTILPEDAKSSYQTAESGYDMYLRDAHKQFSIQETISAEWGWPSKPVSLPEFKSEEFFEGSFLQMLLEKLSRLLNQNYSINLLLTALISRVALTPHPNLHEYLLDPFLPKHAGTRTLHSVLIKVVNDIKQLQQSDLGFSQKLSTARKRLLGLMPTIHSDEQGFDEQGHMEAIIVLEEFCKELSAIAFVKHHAAVIRH